MASNKNADRIARDRLRRYNARHAVHVHQLTRRRRDNIIAVASVLVVVTIATISQVIYFTAGPGMPVPSASPSAGASASPSAAPSASPAAGQNVGDVPPAALAQNRTWTGTLSLNDIPLGIELDGARAPQATSVFISLAQRGYFTANACHRLTAVDRLKVIQCGKPNGTTSIDPVFSFGPLENVPQDGMYPAGTIAMARAASPYSQSTQFFITYGDSFLDPSGGGYTIFGKVTSGLDQFVAQIANAGVAGATGSSPATDGAPAVPTTITGVSVQ